MKKNKFGYRNDHPDQHYAIQMKKYVYIFFALMLFEGCKEHYDLPTNVSSQSFLVVEGMLNSGNGMTTIRLSRSGALNRSTQVQPELNAQLRVEGSDSSSVALIGNSGGFYSAQLSLDPSRLYRVRIHTSNGNEYLSDFVPVKLTPVIDSVTWSRPESDVKIMVNTHDPQNNTWYYRWEYAETWEIHSTYFSTVKYVGPNQIIPRNFPAEDVSVCWKNAVSTNILLGSSARLLKDELRNQPILEIPERAEKLSVRYSINVKQYALTKEAYDYFKVMKTNTESLGTIFDPQPSDVRGNIYNVNKPDERVIGIITAGDVKEKRIFISNSELPGWNFYMDCANFFVDDIPDSIKKYIPSYLPINYTGSGYYVSKPSCVDCTVRGGVTTKPSFW